MEENLFESREVITFSWELSEIEVAHLKKSLIYFRDDLGYLCDKSTGISLFDPLLKALESGDPSCRLSKKDWVTVGICLMTNALKSPSPTLLDSFSDKILDALGYEDPGGELSEFQEKRYGNMLDDLLRRDSDK